MVSVARHSKGNNHITVPSVVIGETEVRSSIIFTLILQYGVGTGTKLCRFNRQVLHISEISAV